MSVDKNASIVYFMMSLLVS